MEIPIPGLEQSDTTLQDLFRSNPALKEAEFLKCEYLSLREEIKETKSRIFRLAVLGIVGVPSVYAIASNRDLRILIISLPLIVCAVMCLYLSESLALMRCGRYIRKEIEPRISVISWERWLEKENQNRTVDKLVNYYFYVLFGLYYFVTSYLSVRMALETGHQVQCCVFGSIYAVVAVIFIVYLVKNLRYSTTTDPEKGKPQEQK